MLKNFLTPQEYQSLQTEKVKRLERQAKARQRSSDYVPRGAMLELRDYHGDEFILSGPAGTGKSRGCLEQINADAWKYAGSRQLIVRKTRVSLTESALVTFERYVLGEDNPICADVQRSNRNTYHYPNGSEVIIGGIDRPGRVMSTEYDRIYVQEATELEITDYESLTSRLRNGVMPFQQIIADCNPDRPDHWLKQRADKMNTMRYTTHKDNPVLWDGAQWTERGVAYLAKLQALTGVRYQRLYLGLWVQAEGAVYDEWNPAIHLIDAFDIPPEWTRIRAIDFGYTNPFVCQWWAIDPDGRMYLYRELYVTQRIVPELAEEIKRLTGDEKIAYTVADHDAGDRATLAKHGVPTRPAVKAISTGIQAVQSRLKIAGDGKARLFIMRGALVQADERLEEDKKPLCTEQEIGGYVWQKGVSGKPNKEQPVDLDNHGMDTMRYAVMSAVTTKKQTYNENPFYG